MPDTAVNRRRGTTAQHAVFTGAVGETTYNTDVKILVAHDGALAGGFPAAHLHVNNLFSIQQRITTTANAPQLILTTSPGQSTQAFQIFQPDGTTQLFEVDFEGITGVYRQAADTTGAQLHHFKRGTTGNATAAVGSGDQLSQDNFKGWDGAAFVNGAQMRVATTEVFTPIARGSQFEFYAVNTGATGLALSAVMRATSVEVYSRLLLPNTTTALLGGIYFGGNRAVHNFGTSNFFAGVNAGNFTLTGVESTGVGVNALTALTSGSRNTAVGSGALQSNTTATNNVAVGRLALSANTTGGSNTAVGQNALVSNLTTTHNTAVGVSALSANIASDNTAVGSASLIVNTTGTRNTAIGRQALTANLIGADNTALGYVALFTVTGDFNTGVGSRALQTVTTGTNNTGVGYAALGNVSAVTGSNNIGLGYQAGNNLTTGSNNIIIGYDIDSPTATNSNTLTLGNIIFGTGIDGTGTTISSGFVGIKVITPVTELHVVTTSAADPRGIMSAQHSADAIGARVHFRKSRGTATAPATVVTGDVLGRLRFSGYDSANYLQMGSIDVVSVGTIAATRVPTYMCFHTATDATPSVLTERLRIDQAGKIQILTGVGADAGGFKHARVTTGSVGAGSTALVTITWTTAFADTNYTVNASVLEATTSSLSMSVVHVESITAAAVTVRVLNNAVGSLTGTVHVIAVHD